MSDDKPEENVTAETAEARQVRDLEKAAAGFTSP